MTRRRRRGLPEAFSRQAAEDAMELREFIRDSRPALTSFAVHLVLLLGLALWVIAKAPEDRPIWARFAAEDSASLATFDLAPAAQLEADEAIDAAADVSLAQVDWQQDLSLSALEQSGMAGAAKPVGMRLDLAPSLPRMTSLAPGDETLRELHGFRASSTALRMGSRRLEAAQASDGSWGYHPRESGDLSIVGWQLMAIKSAMMAGLFIRPEVVMKADRFIDTQQSDGGALYGYRGPKAEPGTTAIGLLLRMYRGWPRTDPRIQRGSHYLNELGPSSNGVYYNYYATQVLFHLGDQRFPPWNERLRDYLVSEQENDGHAEGSWYFPDSHFNEVGGRLYCTALSLLTLEVYYRYMPLYGELESSRFNF